MSKLYIGCTQRRSKRMLKENEHSKILILFDCKNQFRLSINMSFKNIKRIHFIFLHIYFLTITSKEYRKFITATNYLWSYYRTIKNTFRSLNFWLGNGRYFHKERNSIWNWLCMLWYIMNECLSRCSHHRHEIVQRPYVEFTHPSNQE